jgi:predicted metal-dependent hydrolase
MVKHLLPGSPPVALTLKRSGRARRISLRVSQLDGRVTLTLPVGIAETEALDFAASKAEWIRGHLQNRPDETVVGIGAILPLEGTEMLITQARGRRVIRGDTTLAVPDDAAARRLQSWLRELARDRLAEACDLYADRLGRTYSRLTLRDTRSRWGSCTSDGGLMFSWRLILAPPPILHYVAAHEVAHLAEMNHSPAFWATVERIHGPCKVERHWLRREGAALHRFRF